MTIEETIGELWNYATNNKEKEVNAAAFAALSNFTLEQTSSGIPKILQDESILPDKFGNVPGQCWLNILQRQHPKSLPAAADLVATLIAKEISGYLKGTYHVREGSKEPNYYESLPSYSVLQPLANHVKRYHRRISDVEIEILRIMSNEYSKPLPPLDWCFLQELVHREDVKSYVITLASHQVVISGTARRFMENFVVAISDTLNVSFIREYTLWFYLGKRFRPPFCYPNMFLFTDGGCAVDLQKLQIFDEQYPAEYYEAIRGKIFRESFG